MKAKDSVATKRLIKIIICCSIVGLGLAFILINPIKFHICENNYLYGLDTCLGYDNESVPPFLVLFSIVSVFFSITLLFFHEQVFYTWFRFTIVYVPVAVGLIFSATKNYSGGGWISIGPNAVQAVGTLTFGLFFLISLILIIWKFVRMRNKLQKQ